MYWITTGERSQSMRKSALWLKIAVGGDPGFGFSRVCFSLEARSLISRSLTHPVRLRLPPLPRGEFGTALVEIALITQVLIALPKKELATAFSNFTSTTMVLIPLLRGARRAGWISKRIRYDEV